MSMWKSEPVECIFLLLKKISISMKNRYLPHYFMPEKNLLESIPRKTTDECYEKLESARMQPFVPLYLLLHQYTGLSSKIEKFVEDMIENISYYSQSRQNISRPPRNSFQKDSQFLKDLICEGNYQLALMVVEDVLETNGKSINTDGVRLAVDVVRGVSIRQLCCFGLYVGIQHKTNFTTELCKGNTCVSVSDVLGPECCAYLPDTMVPECFSICNGDLQFALDVFDMLNQVVSLTTYIKCMKFYLKRYRDLAGDSLILPDIGSELVRRDFARRGMSGVGATMSTTSLMLLHSLYVNLFDTCRHLFVEEFREMMPTFVLIAESLGTDLSLRNIDIMQLALDGVKTYQ
jgi:hypothetical protein